MVWVLDIQHGIVDHNECLLILVYKPSCQRIVLQFYDLKIADPLPELRLCGPILAAVFTKNACGSLPFFLQLFLFFVHWTFWIREEIFERGR